MRVMIWGPQGGGVGYYRGQVPAAGLRRLGVDVTYQHGMPEDVEKFLISAAKSHDLIHCGWFSSEAHLALLAAAREYGDIPILIDMDDDILSVPKYNPGFAAYHNGAEQRRISLMSLRIADAVSFSTPNLAEKLGKYTRAHVVLPNCLDPTSWDELSVDPLRANDQSTRFMFIGSLGRFGDLDGLEAVFVKSMAANPDIRLFFMGCVPDWALQFMPSTTDPTANRAFVIRSSSIDHYHQIISYIAPDVIFSPLERNEFNKSKSHIKAYDAAMVGAAFLCTDWDTYADVSANSCVKVETTYQWEEAIAALAGDKELRDRLAGRLKTWALSTWTIDKHAQKWVNLYEQVLKVGRVREIGQLVRPEGGTDGLGLRC